MNELFGLGPPVLPAPLPLWAIPLASLVAGLALAARPPARPALLALAALGLGAPLALTLGLGYRLVNLPAGARFHDHVGALLRIGSLDASVAFDFDALSACFSLGALVAASLAVFGALASAPARNGERKLGRELGLALLATGGLLAGALAESAWLLLFSAASLALGAAFGVGSGERGAAARGGLVALPGVVLAIGASLAFWSLGGFWTGGAYQTDFRARYAAVVREAPRAEGEDANADGKPGMPGTKDPNEARRRASARAGLTLMSHGGARVYLGIADQAQLAAEPEPVAVAPFSSQEIPAGAHSIVVEPGGGAVISGDGGEYAVVDRLLLEPGETVTLLPVGPTLVFREIAQQLRLVDASGRPVLLDDLRKKRLFGVRAVFLAALALGLGALLAWAAGGAALARAYGRLLGPRGPEAPPRAALAVFASAFLALPALAVLRFGAVFALSGAVAEGLALAAALLALAAAAAAASAEDRADLLAWQARTSGALLLAGAFAGAPAACALGFAAFASGGALLLFAPPKAAGPLALVASAPLPLAGLLASFGLAWGAARAQGALPLFAGAAAALAAILLAYAAARPITPAAPPPPEAPGKRKRKKGERRAAPSLPASTPASEPAWVNGAGLALAAGLAGLALLALGKESALSAPRLPGLPGLPVGQERLAFFALPVLFGLALGASSAGKRAAPSSGPRIRAALAAALGLALGAGRALEALAAGAARVEGALSTPSTKESATPARVATVGLVLASALALLAGALILARSG